MSEAGGRERRTWERFTMNACARVTQVTDNGLVGPTHECVIEDASRSGLRFRVGVALETEQMVTLETVCGEHWLTGMVRWVRSAETGGYHIGIEAYQGAAASDFLHLVRRARKMDARVE